MAEMLGTNGGSNLPPNVPPNGSSPANEIESLYERFPWLYAICRDHLFRDDTEKIIASLWPAGSPSSGETLLELGCGPGFYARRLAARFEHLEVTGIDRSERQLGRARKAAQGETHREARRGRRSEAGLGNCIFEQGDASALERPSDSADAVVVSRLFFILSERERAISEIHRVLKPGGRCFIAEPRSALRASAPLRAMWVLAALSALGSKPYREYWEIEGATVLGAGEFRELIGSRPWRRERCWKDRWYQYALCEKDSTGSSCER